MPMYACLCSIAIHPDQVRVATGQVAGHDQKEGKVGVKVQSSMSISHCQVIKKYCKTIYL